MSINITEKAQCCGCSSCVQKCPRQCISLISDEEGFLYPKVNKSACIDCGICEKVCPLLIEAKVVEPLKVLSAYNLDEQIRLKSSSGGIFTLLAESIIQKGGVVFGARFDNHWNVILDYTDSIDGIDAFRGSKYSQAFVGDTFKQCKQFLESGRQVLFTGTPCQIAGLRLFLHKDYDNLLAVDIFCHSVPSPLIWNRYLHDITKGRPIAEIQFRNKSNGWKNYHFVIRFKNETVMIDDFFWDNVYMRAFLQNLTIRPSCFACQFRGITCHQSDMSIADFWGIENIHPEMDDDKGTSFVMLNTHKALKTAAELNLKTKEVTNIADTIHYNCGSQEILPYNPRRVHFFCAIHENDSVQKQLRIHTLQESEYQFAIAPFLVKNWYRIKYRLVQLKSILNKQIDYENTLS